MEGNKVRKSKEELERLQKNDAKLQFEKDDIKPPTWLKQDARKMFRKLVSEFEKTGLLVNIDTYALAIFADAYSTYVEYTKTIEEEGHLTEHTNKSGNTNTVTHPLITKKIQLFQQIDKLMGKFGLSPIDRAKLVQNMQVGRR